MPYERLVLFPEKGAKISALSQFADPFIGIFRFPSGIRVIYFDIMVVLVREDQKIAYINRVLLGLIAFFLKPV